MSFFLLVAILLSSTSTLEPAGPTVALMGAPDTETTATDAQPRHRVALGTLFYAPDLVTAREFYLFCKATGRSYALTSRDAASPANQVSWYNALAYCNWLSVRGGLEPVYQRCGASVTADWRASGYRLPTEAEWELQIADRRNVREEAEWVYDRYSSSYYDSSPEQTPYGPAAGSRRVVRGGTDPATGRPRESWRRDSASPDHRSNRIGFRVVKNQELLALCGPE